MANIQVRVDDALRDEAVAVLNRLGMDMATAVRLLLNQIVVDNGYPFKPTSDPFYSSSNIRHLEKVLGKLFKTPIFERWGKQFCLN